MLLHKFYPFSVRNGIKHANVRCFFVADKIEKNEVKLTHYPTEKMITDYSSKYTQGSLFMCQINSILGIKQDYFWTHKTCHRMVLENYDLWDDVEEDLNDL